MAFNKVCLSCGKEFLSNWRVAKFCSRSCSTRYNLSNYWKGKKRKSQTGENNPRWNNGICLGRNSKGYFFLRNSSTKHGNSLHKRIAEYFLGRRLKGEEVVHHINGDILDNHPRNLYVCKDNSEHNLINHRIIKITHSNLPKWGIK